jgi:hypothetical protein
MSCYITYASCPLFSSLCVEAQQLKKVPRIGFLTSDSASDWDTALRRWKK